MTEEASAAVWQGGTVGTRLRALIDDERTRVVLVGGVNTVIGYSLFALAQGCSGETTKTSSSEKRPSK